jgi:hypothetical protein
MSAMHDDVRRDSTGAVAKRLQIVIWTLAALSFAFSLWAATVGWHNTIFDFHGFRQAQTAISAQSIRDGGPILRYETPVLGPPWSVPMEFPLYQLVVAEIARIFGTPIDQTGRFVAELFHFLCFIPLWTILAQLGFSRIQRLPALALFAVSPFYNFISHLVLIESMALFFSMMYLDQIMRLVRAPEGDKKRLWYAVGAMSFGVLAGLVKVTTLAAFFVLSACMLLWHFWTQYKNHQFKISSALAQAFLCLGIPVVITDWWTKFADSVKAQNPFGLYLTSTHMSRFNFGSLADRLTPSNYLRFPDDLNLIVGSLSLALIVLVVAFFLSRRAFWIALISIALYVLAIEIFFALHHHHEYYAYANGIFVVAATGIVLGAMIGLPGKKAWVGLLLFIGMLGACGLRYMRRYYEWQRDGNLKRMETASLIDRTTKPDDVILITGLDWSSELPYLSHRRALMAPLSWQFPAGLDQALRNEGPDNIAAAVICSTGRSEPRLHDVLAQLDMPESTSMHTDDCDVYERTRNYERTGNPDAPPSTK